ncbi:MAG TPA: beta-propeller fold lactonase family protein, partial [Gammaproteobacteria bacterium]|nr:beta-propeller fold lactonase family protein [Gammaproteobacteria bacterium]
MTGISKRGCMALLPACVLTIATVAPVEAQVRLMQTNSTDTVIHLIDPSTNRIVTEIDGIPVAHGIAAAPDGSRIYVSGEAETALKVIDTANMEIIATIPLSARPNNISITPDGAKVYVAIIAEPGAIDVIDTATLENVKSIDVPGGIHNIYVTPDGRNVIAGSIGGRRLTVLDTATDEEVWAWEGEAIRPVAMNTKSDGSVDKLFIQVSGHHGFVVFDWDTRREIERITLPDVPPEQRYDSHYNGAPAHGIGVAPDGETVWSTSRMNSHVYVYSLPDLELVAGIPTGTDPDWIAFTPDSSRAYVANAVTNNVSVIDMDSYT